MVERNRCPTDISERCSGQACNVLKCDNGVDDGEPGPPTLHDCLSSHPLKPLLILSCLAVVPPHDRPLCGKRADVIDTELNELLHDQLGTTSFDQRKGDTQSRRRCRDLDDLAGWLDSWPPAARAPASGAITNGHGVTIAQAQHADKAMTLIVSDNWHLNRLHKDVWAELADWGDVRHQRLKKKLT